MILIFLPKLKMWLSLQLSIQGAYLRTCSTVFLFGLRWYICAYLKKEKVKISDVKTIQYWRKAIGENEKSGIPD